MDKYDELEKDYNRLYDIWNGEILPQGDLACEKQVASEMHRLNRVRHEIVTLKIRFTGYLDSMKKQDKFDEEWYDTAAEALGLAKESVEQVYNGLVNLRAHARLLAPGRS